MAQCEGASKCILAHLFAQCHLYHRQYHLTVFTGFLTVQMRASGTGSSWRFIFGVRGQQAHGHWRLLTHRQNPATLRCLVRSNNTCTLSMIVMVVSVTGVPQCLEGNSWKVSALTELYHDHNYETVTGNINRKHCIQVQVHHESEALKVRVLQIQRWHVCPCKMSADIGNTSVFMTL